jgi:hypothetical protein
MGQKIELPLVMLRNLLLMLEGVFVHLHPPAKPPTHPGPYRAIIDTGSSNTWVCPKIGDLLAPYPTEELDLGDKQSTPEVKFGFRKGQTAKPVEGWVQLDPRLTAYRMLLLSGDSEISADVVIGMDMLCSFVRSAVVVSGVKTQPVLLLEER